MKLQLPDVTLVCIDTICHELASMAVNDCAAKADFGEIYIFTDDISKWSFDENPHWQMSWKKCEDRSLDDVAKTMWYEVPKHIETSHVLFVHWDSGIVDPSMWTDEFLRCDYIGAPWGWHADGRNVGNGGFSLRSARLMHFIKAIGLKPYSNPEDDVLCRQYGSMLEKNGFRFASIPLASRFSVERTTCQGQDNHFGYHGIFRWPDVFSEDELKKRISLAEQSEYLNQPKHLGELRSALDSKFHARV